MKIFLYGTLAEPGGLGRCGGKPVLSVPEPATLPGYRRVLLRGARYPTLRRSPGYAVAGVILRINADMLARLQNYESVRYRQILVRLHTTRGTERARCFLGDAPTRVSWEPNHKIMTLRSRSF